MIEESCKFFDGISSAYVTSATSLVTIEIVNVSGLSFDLTSPYF